MNSHLPTRFARTVSLWIVPFHFSALSSLSADPPALVLRVSGRLVEKIADPAAYEDVRHEGTDVGIFAHAVALEITPTKVTLSKEIGWDRVPPSAGSDILANPTNIDRWFESLKVELPQAQVDAVEQLIIDTYGEKIRTIGVFLDGVILFEIGAYSTFPESGFVRVYDWGVSRMKSGFEGTIEALEGAGFTTEDKRDEAVADPPYSPTPVEAETMIARGREYFPMKFKRQASRIKKKHAAAQ